MGNRSSAGRPSLGGSYQWLSRIYVSVREVEAGRGKMGGSLSESQAGRPDGSGRNAFVRWAANPAAGGPDGARTAEMVPRPLAPATGAVGGLAPGRRSQEAGSLDPSRPPGIRGDGSRPRSQPGGAVSGPHTGAPARARTSPGANGIRPFVSRHRLLSLVAFQPTAGIGAVAGSRLVARDRKWVVCFPHVA